MTSSNSKLSFSVERVPVGVGNLNEAVLREDAAAMSAMPQYAGCVKVGPYLYVTGATSAGRGLNGKPSQTIAMLNVKTKRWKFMRCEGYITTGAGVFLYEDSMFSLNSVDHMRLPSGRLSRFDLALNEWSFYDTIGERPGPRRYFSGDFMEKLNRYVVFGGARDDNSVYLLDLPERHWSKAISSGTPPESRADHGSCVHDGLIYMYGGRDNDWQYNDGLFILKVESGRRVTWSSPRTNNHVIGPLRSFVFIPVGRILLLCGGILASGSRASGSHGLSYYDTDLREFREAELRPETREMLGPAMCGDRDGLLKNSDSIVLLGGYTSLRYMIRVTVKDSLGRLFATRI